MAHNEFQLRVVLFWGECGHWVAQGLEFDISAQGKTIPEAMDAFVDTVAGQLMFDAERGVEPFEGFEVAPQEFQRKWDEGFKAQPKAPRHIPDSIPVNFRVPLASPEVSIYA